MSKLRKITNDKCFSCRNLGCKEIMPNLEILACKVTDTDEPHVNTSDCDQYQPERWVDRFKKSAIVPAIGIILILAFVTYVYVVG